MNEEIREEEKWGKTLYFFAVVMFILIVFGVYHAIKNWSNNQEPAVSCEQSYILERSVNAYGRDWIDEKVIDYYVIKKKISENYWYKICNDLLKIELNETLSKSDNLFIEANSPWFHEENYQLKCGYNIFWGKNVGYYGNTVESGERIFDTTEILLAQEKRQPRYNQSLIKIEWNEELMETKIKNDNSDYNVLLNLKLNESFEICNG